MKMIFFRCPICGNIVAKVMDSGVDLVCCGRKMEPLVPKSEEEGSEKHLPVVTSVKDNLLGVEVGSKPHPMEESHHIQWLFLQTEEGGQMLHLHPNNLPSAHFCCRRCHPIALYAYCNVHGLWMTDLKKSFDECYY